jgi:hypothetical protein
MNISYELIADEFYFNESNYKNKNHIGLVLKMILVIYEKHYTCLNKINSMMKKSLRKRYLYKYIYLSIIYILSLLNI